MLSPSLDPAAVLTCPSVRARAFVSVCNHSVTIPQEAEVRRGFAELTYTSVIFTQAPGPLPS